ncbi:MAG: SDR family oxidoreductase [Candidatus Aminicenantes bacterium]|nr:SDR family oxidoreductase [Candidatus Aminicenantes bacterium]
MSAKVVLVTGATGHIGQVVAKRLALDFEHLALHYFRNKKDADHLVSELKEAGKNAFAFQSDLTTEEGAARLVKMVLDRFGRLDVLVNMPGDIKTKPWDELNQEDWESIFRSNLESAYFCLKQTLPAMRRQKWGRVINIGFHLVEHLGSFPGVMPYAVAKTGLLILTRTAAVAEVGNGITVNMVSPGLLEGGVLPTYAKLKPGQVGKPEEVAEAIAFLASEKAGGITGTNLLVAGTWKM